jgi:hypothetical protein
MKKIFSIAKAVFGVRKGDSVSLSEAIPFWFAVSSPVIGLTLGVFGAWVFAWLTS